MLIGGIQTLTLLDFPEKVACIIFTAGCNFRCGFCHNPQFVDPEEIKNLQGNFIPEDKFFSFLKSRGKFLDGVVISGGEPTIQPDLIDFVEKIKKCGLLVKLDTNGTNPDIVEKMLKKNLLDYVAMDIKNSPENYNEICDTQVNIEKITKTKNLLLNSKIPYEFRTTVLREFHNKDEITKIADFIKGAQKYTIQNFRPEKTLNKKFEHLLGFEKKELEEFKKIAEKTIPTVKVL